MLYLIRTYGIGGKSYLKVGFTDNIQNRLNQYKIHNPLLELISTREGTQDEELMVQLYLQTQDLKANFLNEWFVEDSKVCDIFHKPIQGKKFKKVLWRNRELLFTPEDFNNPRRRKIYESLRDYFGTGNKELDREWKMAESREVLKKYKEEYEYERSLMRLRGVL